MFCLMSKQLVEAVQCDSTQALLGDRGAVEKWGGDNREQS